MFDFKGFINALFLKKPADPVGSLKSATVWVQELPQGDIHRAQQEVVAALGKLNGNGLTSLRERIRVLLYLDEKAHSLQQTLCREYLASLDSPGAPAQQFLPTILQFWAEMARGYEISVRLYSSKPTGGTVGDQIPLLIAKAIHFLAMQAKWSVLRYMPVEGRVWRHLHRLYHHAEQHKLEHVPVRLYSQQDETSCTREYLQPLMLHLANPASLLPPQIELVDHWLDSWAGSLVIEKDFRPQRQLYAVSLEDSKPPRKLRRNMLGEKYRYWGVGLLMVNIGKIVEQLQQGELPARLKLGEDCRLPACLDLIEEVGQRWAGQTTTRKHERVSAEKTLVVMEGLGNIIEYLKAGKQAGVEATYNREDADQRGHFAPTPNGAPELFDSATQQWQVENESLSGYGVTFSQTPSAQLKIGTLVGLKAAISADFMVGIVRRIHNEPPKVFAGIQTLSPTPLWVQLHPLPGERGTPVGGIYLPELAKLQLGRSLLLPSGAHAPGKLVQLKAQGKVYTIRLQPAVEQTKEYTRAGFDVVAKG